MPEMVNKSGAAEHPPLLDRILEKLETDDYPNGSSVAQMRDSFLCMLRKRRKLGISPYSSFVFAFPENTESVSVTGAHCDLNCAHCDGHYLQGMASIDEFVQRLDREEKVPDSILVSGGCNVNGGIPVPSWDLLKRLKGRVRLNFHVGLADVQQMETVARFADAISFEMVSSAEAAERVMGLKYGMRDYIETYRTLRDNVPEDVSITPHVVVGLNEGSIEAEYELIDTLVQDEPESMAFLVLRPTLGTEFENISPPSLVEVTELFLYARKMLGRSQFHLGCMRPSGRYRAALDLIAAACDFDVLVQPTRRVRHLLSEICKNNIYWSDQCCSLSVGPEEKTKDQYSSLREFLLRKNDFKNEEANEPCK